MRLGNACSRILVANSPSRRVAATTRPRETEHGTTMLAGSLATPPGAVRLAAVITHTSGARVRAARGAPRQAAAAAAAVRTPERGVQGSEVQEGAQVVGTVLWAGPKGAKVQLADDTIGFMPSREAPFVIRDALEECSSAPRREVRREMPRGRATRGATVQCGRPPPRGRRHCTRCGGCCLLCVQGPCVPKGLVRAFKVINVPAKGAGKAQAGPLLSARLCDLDVLWHRAAQLCDLSTQARRMCGSMLVACPSRSARTPSLCPSAAQGEPAGYGRGRQQWRLAVTPERPVPVCARVTAGEAWKQRVVDGAGKPLGVELGVAARTVTAAGACPGPTGHGGPLRGARHQPGHPGGGTG